MNRTPPTAWIFAGMAICCVVLAFFFLTSVDPAQPPPKADNVVKATAKPSLPALLDDTASRVPGDRTMAAMSIASESVADFSGTSDFFHPPQEQPQGDSLLAPVLPANDYTLDDVTGTIKVGGRTQKLTGTEGLFDRVMIGETEKVSIRLDMPNLVAGEEVVVAASNGGRLERHNGSLRFIPKGDTAMLDLTFVSTMGRGAYSIDVRHAGAIATVTLWAGEPLPAGEPGPNFVPLPPSTETIP